ncbi:hypothetical protein BJ322DRAFT_1069790 [Thelephora terrestris]|uniref:F-box domain-containing protein n=1 Tax=Thelephora terrestris TaxID=56493 RepID=A0A9P6HAZ8_9AGAM|nr:hypothetical protein BJ322DRAFT_1069790 [Thelephora terrestris]
MLKANLDGRLPGTELFASTVWHRLKARFVGILAHRPLDPPTTRAQPSLFPPEIEEMIIAHLKYDTPALKACAATCFRWYTIATPHLHRVLILQEWTSNKFRNQRSNPLSSLFKLGLLPFVKQLQLRGIVFGARCWIAPAVFDSRTMQYFRAMINLQVLEISNLDFSKFPVGFEKYFGHFAPTLRSVALSRPNGTRRQLLDFFRLFPKLDDIGISSYSPMLEEYVGFDNQLVAISGGLRGRLTLHTFGEEGLLKDIIVAFGGMRFTSMDLRRTRGVQLLLDTCADTLEILRIYPEDMYPCTRPFNPVYSRVQNFNLSSSTALRSIEMPILSLFFSKQVLSTITSPMFYELVVIFPGGEVGRPSGTLVCVLRELYEVREFSVAFCLEALQMSRAEDLRKVKLEAEVAVEAGLYDFLPRPPLVFFQKVANYVPHYTS